MIEFLISILPTSLFIYGVHILFQDNHLLEKQGEWMATNWPEWITKPLFDCQICQSSIWGTVGFFSIDFLFGVHHNLRLYIPYVFCLCGLNVIIQKLTSKEREVKITKDGDI